ncbi:MAG: ribonuclease J [Candidatus Promineifilaceae bacterium]
MSSKLRIIPIGGCGEVGKNMTVIEYEDSILIIDAGIMFPHNDMLGVDSIIPDWNYLSDKFDKVKAILITHGHEDHIGAISYFVRNTDAPIYATPLTAGLISSKLRESKQSGKRLETIQAGDAFAVGPFLVEPFHMTHSIPDCVGFGITTPVGLIVYTGDYKFDHTPVDGWPPDFAKLSEFSARGVLCLLADSTNSEVKGWTQSEQVVTGAMKNVFAEAKGRVIVASFASLISRIWQVSDAAHVHGRKLAIAGRSMREYVKIAQKLGYLDLPDDLIVDVSQANGMPDNKVAIMATGSQGEPMSVLGRLARGRHHKLKIKEGDTIVISAHTIPGNEETINRIINMLLQKGAEVLYENNSMVHVSGHASQDEMKLLINLVRPKFMIPIHGELRQLRQHGKLAKQMGMKDENVIVIENGTPVELTETTVDVQPRMRGGYIFVQGGSAGEVGFPQIRNRERLARAGFFHASVRLNSDAMLIGKPQVTSEGFIDLKDESELIEGVADVIQDAASQYRADWKQLHSHIEGAVSRYLYVETRLRPQVYVVIHS